MLAPQTRLLPTAGKQGRGYWHDRVAAQSTNLIGVGSAWPGAKCGIQVGNGARREWAGRNSDLRSRGYGPLGSWVTAQAPRPGGSSTVAAELVH